LKKRLIAFSPASLLAPLGLFHARAGRIKGMDPFSMLLALACLAVVLLIVAIFLVLGLPLLIWKFFDSELRTCPNCKKLVSKRGGFCPLPPA